MCYIFLLYSSLSIILNGIAFCSVNCHIAENVMFFGSTFNHSDVNNSLGGTDGVRADAQIRAGVRNLHVGDEQSAVVSTLRSSLVRFRRKLSH